METHVIGAIVGLPSRRLVSAGSASLHRDDVISKAVDLTVEHLREGLLVVDERGAILSANHQAETIFRYLPGELVGVPFATLFPEQSHLAHDELWAEFWRAPHGSCPGGERVAGGVRKDGQLVPLEIRLNVVIDVEARYLVASIVDITERTDLEARLAAATNERLGFQRLVAEIASRLGTIEPDAVEDALLDVFRQVGEALQLDVAALWRKSAGSSRVVPARYWVHPTCPSPPDSFPTSSMPFAVSKLEAREAFWFTRLEEVPDPVDRETFRGLGLQSAALMPLTSGGEEGVLTALAFGTALREQDWTRPIIERLRLIAGVVNQAFARRASHVALQNALDEIRQLRDRLSEESVELRRDIKLASTSQAIVSESAAIQRTLAQVQQVAPRPATVLLLGETGAGKEVIAQALHDLSPRHQRPMVRVSCAAIPTALIESELFGRERGAYTGALSRQIGRFEAATQSTLFLDEIGELPLEVQVKL